MKVLKIKETSIRNQIEKITEEDEIKGSIKFQKDINGDWVVGTNVIDDPDFQVIKHLLLQYGEEIEFAGLPLPDDM